MAQTFDTRTAITFTFPDAAVTIADQGGGVAVNLSTAGVFGGLLAANNLSDVASAATARSNLGAAPLASPALTGTPTSTTAAPGTNTTQIATTAFVNAAIGDATIWVSASATNMAVLTDVYLISPVAGTISVYRAVADAQPDNNVTLAATIAGVAVTNGTTTVLATDVAGTVRSATPSAANTVAAGQAVRVYDTTGTNTTSGTMTILMGIVPT